jgi:hypothetical protein
MLLDKRARRAVAVLLCAIAISSALDAQGRFRALSRDTLGGLEVVTMLDTAQNACYLLFVAAPASSASSPIDPQLYDVASAAAIRDQRLAELNYSYLQSYRTPTPGLYVVDDFWFKTEAQKVINEYERIVRQNELAWLAARIEGAGTQPRLAVSGPAPCDTRPAAQTPGR